MGHQSYVLLCSKMTSFLPSEGVSEITFGSISSRTLCGITLLLEKAVNKYFCLSYCLFLSACFSAVTHCYFTRLKPKRDDPFKFCLPALLGIHTNPKQKEYLKSSEGFLR
jgi:hypothetical protein